MEHINIKDVIQFRRLHLIALTLFAISAGHLVINRSNWNLKNIPTDINPNVTELRLSSNSIERVEDGDLAGLVRLEQLYLDHNKISFIGQAAFINNIKLVKLVLRDSYTLPEFPPGFGGSSPFIKDLQCIGGVFINQTVHLTGFTALENFVISKNQIKLEIGNLPSLKRLYAQECGLEKFPNLSGAPRLEWAQLHKNLFTEIPQSAIMGLTNLTKLVFPACRVMYLPDLSHLVSLEILKAPKNYLISLSDLYHLPLTELKLSDNPWLCDKRLCWIRMWSSVKPALQLSAITCAHPQKYVRSELMNIHPTDMLCYEGNIRHKVSLHVLYYLMDHWEMWK